MFNLRRYFSIACAAALVVVTAVVLILYRQSAMAELVDSAEGQNVILARSFANILWPRFEDYVMSVTDVDGESLRARPETRELHEVLKMLTAGLPVLKVKIYNLDGLTIYSSEPSQIGDSKSNNQGFLMSARVGIPASKLSYRDTFSAYSGTLENRDLVESYLPIWDRGGAIEAVFELYTDVTPSMDRIERRTTRLMLFIVATFGLFYGVLFLIIRRADRILKRQYVNIVENRESIEKKNLILEHEVSERARAEEALQEAHDTLEHRVEERTAELERKGEDLAHLAEDLMHARDKAETANRAKSEFLANMSHELRTPLNAIIGFSEVIETETLGPVGSVKYRDYAMDINRSGLHLLDLINDILDLSRIESGVVEIYEKDIEFPEVLHAVQALVRERAQRGGIELDFEYPDTLPALRADERLLKQILINLLSNAIKFSQAGGKVAVSIQCREDSGHVIQVADAGIGIAPKDISKVLSKFGRVDGDLCRKYDGAGLGLPLTKVLVELHGGSLDLQSEIGVGTTVTLRFPAARVVQARPGEEVLGIDGGTAR